MELNLTFHERQKFCLDSLATEILYGGAAGGGKSHFLRMAAILWASAIPGLQVYLFRRHYPDLIKNHMEGPTSFPITLAPWIESDHCKIVQTPTHQIRFWNGSKIHLCHCQYDQDVLKYQGAEIHVLLIDELTLFSEFIYRFLRGRLRLGALSIPEPLRHIFPRIVCGSNPGSIGHNWVKANFISGHKHESIWQATADEGGMLRQYIPARLDDNPTLQENDPAYALRLSGLGSEALVKAMLDGNWDIVAGGALDDVFHPKVIVPRFKVPRTWRCDRAMDWGSARPFSILWFAESDGTEAKIEDKAWEDQFAINLAPGVTLLPKQTTFCPPRKSLVVFHEWYGSKKPNEGLMLPPREVSQGIKRRQEDLLKEKWITVTIHPGPADNAIFSATIPGTPTVAKEMEKDGILWTPSDKNPGTRKTGLQLLRARFSESKKDLPEYPALYIMDHCRSLIEHLPVLPRDKSDPDDVDSDAEDHDYDAIRYRVLAADRKAVVKKLQF